MPVITYVARRSIIGGHSDGNTYQIETDFYSRELATKFIGERRVTLDGTPESWLDRIERRRSIQTDLITAATLPNWREFLDSVMNAETFEIDFTGTIASPGTDVTVWLESMQIAENEVAGPIRQFSFVVVEL